MPFVRPVKISSGDYSDSAGSDINNNYGRCQPKTGETRIDLLHKNTSIFKGIIGEMNKINRDCILLVVTKSRLIYLLTLPTNCQLPKNKL
jgi:L-lactate dehydrogenase